MKAMRVTAYRSMLLCACGSVMRKYLELVKSFASPLRIDCVNQSMLD